MTTLNDHEKQLIQEGKIFVAVNSCKDRIGISEQEAIDVVAAYVQYPEFNETEKKLIEDGKMMKTIKKYRERNGTSLAVSKFVYDQFINKKRERSLEDILSMDEIDRLEQSLCTHPGCSNFVEKGFVYCITCLHGKPVRADDIVLKHFKRGPYYK